MWRKQRKMSRQARPFAESATVPTTTNMGMDWLSAFGTGGFPDEPSLMEELDINLPHVWDKSLAVLNPFHKFSPNHPKDAHMMDDTDLAGPLLFCFVFGMLLLLVREPLT